MDEAGEMGTFVMSAPAVQGETGEIGDPGEARAVFSSCSEESSDSNEGRASSYG